MSPNPSAAAAENPDSPTTTPTPPASPVSSPVSSLFLPPKGPSVPLPPPPSSSMSPAGSSPTTSLPGDDVEAPTWSAGYADSEETSDRDGSGSTPSAKASVSRAGLRAVVGRAVKTVTNALASIAADSVERDFDLWRADEDDVAGIATPTASLLYRRLPDEAKDSDTLDLLSLALGVAAYVGKNLRRKAELRVLREQGVLGEQPAAAAAAPA